MWEANVITSDEQYFAELSDNESDESVPYDNLVIEASNDEEAIDKASKWAASRKLGVVAMLSVKQGVRGVHSRKIYLGLRPDHIWSNPDAPLAPDQQDDLSQQPEQSL
jgi:hypothetical protein